MVCGLARPVLNSGPMLCRSMLRASACRLAALLVLSAGSAAATAGGAPTTTEPMPTLVTRTVQNVDLKKDWINRQDCIDNAEFTFTLPDVGATVNDDLEVWASQNGARCEDTAVQGDGSCREVFNGNTSVARQVSFSVRPILRPETGPLTTQPDETVCEREVDRENWVLRFFYRSSSGGTIGATTVYPVSYDLVGPPPPTSVKAGIGEQALIVSWNDPSTPGDDFGGYNIYVRALDTPDGGAVDAGDGGTPMIACASEDLIPGQLPTVTETRTSGIATTNAEVGGLTNGVTYVVAVASIDLFENPSVLSDLDCGAPEPVTGFFEAYRAAGGGGGGGYCAMGAATSGVAAVGIALAALGLITRRRRRAASAKARGSA